MSNTRVITDSNICKKELLRILQEFSGEEKIFEIHLPRGSIKFIGPAATWLENTLDLGLRAPQIL